MITPQGNYRYSCYIANLSLPAPIVYVFYRGRADSENRIKELKPLTTKPYI